MKHERMSVIGLILLLQAGAAGAETLHIYNWADYFAEDILAKFTAETGIEIEYDTYDSDELLMTRLLTGNSGYDVVFPGTAFASDMLVAGVFQEIDQTIVRNQALVDPAVQATLMPTDTNMRYTVPYTTAVTGYAYDADKIAALFPGVTPDSWAWLSRSP